MLRVFKMNYGSNRLKSQEIHKSTNYVDYCRFTQKRKREQSLRQIITGCRSRNDYDPYFKDTQKAKKWFLDNGWWKGCHTHRINPNRGYWRDNIVFLTPKQHSKAHVWWNRLDR